LIWTSKEGFLSFIKEEMSFNLKNIKEQSKPILDKEHFGFKQIISKSDILPNNLFWSRNEVECEQLKELVLKVFDKV
jgi:hypothetical protein